MGAAPFDGRCQKIRPDLSAFIDTTLPQKRWDQVCYHLASCAACRGELNELSEVRSALCRQREARADAPADLASRLERIAGEGAAHPLYLSPDGGPDASALPSRRRAMRRLAAQSGVAVLAVAVVVMILAVAVAPAPVVMAAPVETAREQFNLVGAAIGVNESVGAVLLAHERGASFDVSRHEEPFAVAEEQALRISTAAAAQLLDRSLDPGLNYSGLQRVAVSHEGDYLTADVQVAKVEGEGTSMVVLDARGDRFVSTVHPEFRGRLTEPLDAWSLSSWRFYHYPMLDTVAGRSAGVIEARADGRVTSRWWIDVPTGVLLRMERFDSGGRPTLMAGFESISFEDAAVPDDAQQLIVLMPVSASGVAGWCPDHVRCAPSLAGLPLVAFSSQHADDEAVLLVYSDGFQSITVSWSAGMLPADAPHGPQRTSGQPSVLARQAGESVILVATNGSPALLAQAAEELPGETPFPDSPADWVRRGLERLFAFG
ncbi:MAG TPA: hypothetical protein PKE40_02615 [Arachnia sp.]|nr:hypothetical protein [Arachnia sp.]HMT85223.1 hypothetical protein [Arachnia sp.]